MLAAATAATNSRCRSYRLLLHPLAVEVAGAETRGGGRGKVGSTQVGCSSCWVKDLGGRRRVGVDQDC